jgi:hypothetical protein
MTQTTRHLPVLKYTNGTWHLLVDGKPYLVLGAELQNSSMSSASYMETVWEKLAKMGVNTILGTVAWEDIERKEGEFDFSELDKVFRAARSHGFRVVLLWFGSFKNGMFTRIGMVSGYMLIGVWGRNVLLRAFVGKTGPPSFPAHAAPPERW